MNYKYNFVGKENLFYKDGCSTGTNSRAMAIRLLHLYVKEFKWVQVIIKTNRGEFQRIFGSAHWAR